MPTTQQRFRGCLLGLAVGDALGAPVEFMTIEAIRSRFGPRGIADLVEWGGFPAGYYTDDTQMSLATAEACLVAERRFAEKGIVDIVGMVHHFYLQWLGTQAAPQQSRYPGNTCLRALHSGVSGTISAKINNSKGCGGVMRTSPAGLAYEPGRAFDLGAQFAAITHGHPSGYLSAGYLSELISRLVRGEGLVEAAQSTKTELLKYEGHGETLTKIEEAESLAASTTSTDEALRLLGEGWVGEEALAVALYCALRSSDNWRTAVLMAANHSGDSDSTASICGAILGTNLGEGSIPTEWLAQLENRARITQLADAMWDEFSYSFAGR